MVRLRHIRKHAIGSRIESLQRSSQAMFCTFHAKILTCNLKFQPKLHLCFQNFRCSSGWNLQPAVSGCVWCSSSCCCVLILLPRSMFLMCSIVFSVNYVFLLPVASVCPFKQWPFKDSWLGVPLGNTFICFLIFVTRVWTVLENSKLFLLALLVNCFSQN